MSTPTKPGYHALDDIFESIESGGQEYVGQGAWYSSDADCVFCFAEDVDHYAERVDKVLTVYRAEQDDHIIGLQIKAISQLPRDDLLYMSKMGEMVAITSLVVVVAKHQRKETRNAEVDQKYLDAMTSVSSMTIPVKELAAL